MLQLDTPLVKSMVNICPSLIFGDYAEDNVHILQSSTLRLLDEEYDESAVSNAEDAKHDEGSPADMVDSSRRNFGDDKVKQPLGGGCKTNAIFTEAGGEDLDQC